MTVSIMLDPSVYETAKRVADKDGIQVGELVADLVRRHAAMVDAFGDIANDQVRFDIDNYDIRREPGESDAEYADRVALFR